jgi:hypothetical protein
MKTIMFCRIPYMFPDISIRVERNRKRLIKLSFITLITWILSLFFSYTFYKNYGTADEFLWANYDNYNYRFWLKVIFILIVGYIWNLASVIVFIMGVYNFIIIRKEKLKVFLVDILIILFPLFIYAIKAFVHFSNFQPGLNLPIY